MKLQCVPPTALTDEEIGQITEAAVRIAADVPLRVTGASPGGREDTYTDQLLAMLRAFGCRVSDEQDRVHFPEEVIGRVTAAIAGHRASMPESEADYPEELSISASGQALWCCDPQDDHLRAATVKDLADLSRVVDAIEGLGRSHPTFIPQDVPAATAEVHAFATIILNSSGPYRVSVYTAELLPHFIELDTIARGDREAVNSSPTFAAKAWWNTPFMLTGENIGIAMKARELMGLPVTVSTMPVAGAATPTTLAGSLALMTAEVLQCNAISLAVDDRVMGWTAGPLTIDPRSGIHTQSGPDTQLLGLGAQQIAAHLFGGTLMVQGGPTTGAKVPGAQAMMEKTVNTTWAILGGRRSFGSLATLAFADVGSVVQLMLDIEMCSHLQRLLRGIRVDAETIAEEVIREVAPRGAYFLGHEHTVEHFRQELWLPELVDLRVPMAWIDEPGTMVDNARAKALRLLETGENQCPLTDQQRQQVREVVADAERLADEKGLEDARRI
ncbi:MAG: trimethylamine methyltransferase family protein [Armatimonadota bacterium]|nr:trimethylamine methyltransferase family protein [Armatimonadota bacterium]